MCRNNSVLFSWFSWRCWLFPAFTSKPQTIHISYFELLIAYLWCEILFDQARTDYVLVKLTIWGTLVSLTKTCSMQILQVPVWLLQTWSKDREGSFGCFPPCVSGMLAFSLLTTLLSLITLPTLTLMVSCACRSPASDFLRKSYLLRIACEDKKHSNSASYDVLFILHPAILSYRILEIIQPLISNWVKYPHLF